ncbi:MAG: carbamoyltransferase C-terminal domain-containing protein [Rickettsiales bacterium]|nr:carbamoyltransferase C-terminal domain-containing protein [Rickettsiales bacterium]
MNILSINFGHDASFSWFQDGHLRGFLELERLTRYKHVIGVTAEDLESFLTTCGISMSDVDVVAVSSTQLWGIRHDEHMSVQFGYSPAHSSYVTDSVVWAQPGTPFLQEPGGYYNEQLKTRQITHASKILERLEFSYPFVHGALYPSSTLDSVCQTHKDLAQKLHENHDLYRLVVDNFITPCSFTFRGKTWPAFHVNHHYAHAAYGHFYSASPASFIASHDGGLPGMPFNSGGIYYGVEDKIIPLLSHGLALGYIYDQLSLIAGFSEGDGPGKLMGLAPYGFASPAVMNLVVESINISAVGHSFNRKAIDEVIQKIAFIAKHDQNIRHEAVKPFNFNFADTALSIAIAANAQKLVEETYAQALAPYLCKMLDAMPNVTSVSSVGGFTLNCPANTRLQMMLGKTYLNPLPGAIDTGISIGAGVAIMSLAQQAYHRPQHTNDSSPAFPCSAIEVNEEHQADERFIAVDYPDDLPSFLGHALADGKIICLLRGRSEIGPRALGHRSILAKTSDARIRDDINAKKGRENWRPLAPMIRKQDFAHFFSGNAETCRFMLFTYPVTNDRIPAVTHVDGTARVQVIDEQDALLNGILATLEERGEPPVIINTSFNVAGEPIVETPAHAFNSFHKLGFDYLVIEDRIYQNAKSASRPYSAAVG